MQNLKVQRDATLPSGESRSVERRTLNDVTVGTKCTLIGPQRRDGQITIGRIELP